MTAAARLRDTVVRQLHIARTRQPSDRVAELVLESRLRPVEDCFACVLHAEATGPAVARSWERHLREWHEGEGA